MRIAKRQIIEEVASAYNSDNRSIDADGTARYVHWTGKRDSVGRFFKEDIDKQILADNQEIACLLADYEQDEVFKEEYRGHPAEFWTDIQRLHDKDIYWDQNGLSEKGKAKLERIKTRWLKFDNQSNGTAENTTWQNAFPT